MLRSKMYDDAIWLDRSIKDLEQLSMSTDIDKWECR